MIDLDKVVPLPQPHSYDADQQEGWWTVDQIRAIRLAAWNVALEAAIKAVEHEAFPSELPRFRVVTDWLRDMRIEPEPK